MTGPAPIVADLRAESDALDALVAPLPPGRWADPTPAAGWTIAHQIGHLLWTDRVALIAVTDEPGFSEVLAGAAADPAGFVDKGAEELAAVAPAELLADWRATRDRLRSIAHLGVRTRDYAFAVNNLTPPAEPFLVELRGPRGDTWSWGPPEAVQRVTGSAEDFCFLVTQRRPLSALDITADGADAQRWLEIAQAFAGPPGPGR